ncbi:hypothetical protein G6F31_016785 [Rhizopus arrhizus]|nr:hypothetical protein G6F31_016785 [Rhizopus arrhizus]
MARIHRAGSPLHEPAPSARDDARFAFEDPCDPLFQEICNELHRTPRPPAQPARHPPHYWPGRRHPDRPVRPPSAAGCRGGGRRRGIRARAGRPGAAAGAERAGADRRDAGRLRQFLRR